MKSVGVVESSSMNISMKELTQRKEVLQNDQNFLSGVGWLGNCNKIAGEINKILKIM